MQKHLATNTVCCKSLTQKGRKRKQTCTHLCIWNLSVKPECTNSLLSGSSSPLSRKSLFKGTAWSLFCLKAPVFREILTLVSGNTAAGTSRAGWGVRGGGALWRWDISERGRMLAQGRNFSHSFELAPEKGDLEMFLLILRKSRLILGMWWIIWRCVDSFRYCLGVR